MLLWKVLAYILLLHPSTPLSNKFYINRLSPDILPLVVFLALRPISAQLIVWRRSANIIVVFLDLSLEESLLIGPLLLNELFWCMMAGIARLPTTLL